MLPLLHENQVQGVDMANRAIAFTEEPEDAALADDLLAWMARARADFTGTFRTLSPSDPASTETRQDADFEAWLGRWRARLGRQRQPAHEVVSFLDPELHHSFNQTQRHWLVDGKPDRALRAFVPRQLVIEPLDTGRRGVEPYMVLERREMDEIPVQNERRDSVFPLTLRCRYRWSRKFRGSSVTRPEIRRRDARQRGARRRQRPAAPFSGLTHDRPGNLEKSRSVVYSVAPCSTAMAASAASIASGPAAWPSSSSR